MNRLKKKKIKDLKSSIKWSDREEQSGKQLIIITALFNYQFLSMSIIICLMSLIKTSFCSLSVISQPGEMAVICFISWGAALFSVWTFQQYLWKSCTLLNSLFFPPHHLPRNGQRCWSHLGGFGTFHSRKIQNFHSFLHLMPRSLSPITKLWLLFLILSGRQRDSNKPLLFSCSSLGSVYHFKKAEFQERSDSLAKMTFHC